MPPRGLHPKARTLFQSCRRMLGAVDGNLPWHKGRTRAEGGLGSLFMVISAASREGRTMSAASMGWALGPMARTLLVDAHVQAQGLSALFGAEDDPGLSEVLAGRIDLDDAILPTERTGLFLLPAGHKAESAVAFYRQEGFAAMLDRLRRDWDRVIFDTPPFLDYPDAPVMAHDMDGAILVVSSEETHRAVAALVKDRLEAARGTLVGVVLNQRKLHIPEWLYRAL
jgi:receptor protein-tyrosine kinase